MGEHVKEVGLYSVTDAAIAKMGDQYMEIVVTGPDDAENFKIAHLARMVVKGKRVEVEKCRVTLKADALAYGRKIDTEAKRITALLKPIEDHLIAQERVVTDEKARIEREAEEARQAKREAEERATREAEEKKMADERDRLAKIEAEQKAERNRLAKIEAEQQAERDRIEAEKRKIAEAEDTKHRAEEMEKAKAEAAERARIETEERVRREAEEAKEREETARLKAEAERARIEAAMPDAERIEAFAVRIRDVASDSIGLDTPEALAFMRRTVRKLDRIVVECQAFAVNLTERGAA